LLDLLKWNGKPLGTRDDYEKYHAAISNIHPMFISDPDPTTVGAGVTIAGRPFAGGVPRYIVFSAEFADDNNAWTKGVFMLEFDNSDSNRTAWHYKLKAIWTAPGFDVWN